MQLSAGDISLAIASAAEGQGAAAGQPVPVFEVDDIEAALAAVSAGGGSAGDVRDMGDHERLHAGPGAAAERGCEVSYLAAAFIRRRGWRQRRL